jgi:GDP-D-mannose 3', 5'-epimerase
MKFALVCGAGGFIRNYIVKRLKRDGFWVRGVDIKHHEFDLSAADEFIIADLRDADACRSIVDQRFDDRR